jgi:hypothetical protein
MSVHQSVRRLGHELIACLIGLSAGTVITTAVIGQLEPKLQGSPALLAVSMVGFAICLIASVVAVAIEETDIVAHMEAR